MQNLKLTTLNLLALSMITPLGQPASADNKAGADSDVEEIVIIKRRESDYSVITERAQKIVDVPGALGDPLMAVFSLPGVLSQAESGAPAVRGSSPADNRYLVDGAPAGYVFHSFSTSIFNENIIQDFQLYSAGFGANYGNAIGGVFDITLRDPKHQPITTKVDLGVLRSGIFFEGEASENSAFYLSARTSMTQYFFDDEAKKDLEKDDGIRVQSIPQDTDYQFKYSYTLDDTNKITLSANGATDLAAADFTNSATEVAEDPEFAGEAKIKNGFNNAVLSWQQKNDGEVFNLQLGHYVNDNKTYWGDKKYHFDMKNEDTYVIAKKDFVLFKDHNISAGGELHHLQYRYSARFINYICTETDPDCLFRRGELVDTNNTLTINEGLLYANDHWNVTDAVALDLGLQSHYNDYTKENFIHPRVALAWNFIDDWTFTSSLGTYDRFPDIDKLFPEVGNPTLKSPTANHFTLGLKQLLDDGWSWSVTAYYKTMDDLPLAMDVNQLPHYTNNVTGEAYGVDVFVNKELTDRWYGWLAVSASKSLRTNELTHVERDYYLDTPVVLNWVMNYKISDLWTGGMRFTAQTGRAYTPIIGAQKNPYFDNHILPIYGEAFSQNLPTYTRLDVRFKREMSLWGYKGTYNIDILNALNTRNVTDRTLDYKRTVSLQNYKLEDQVGLGIIPALGLSLTF